MGYNEGLEDGGSLPFLERKSCQCVEILPNSGSELCLQGSDQELVQDLQGCSSSSEVWNQHCQWRICRNSFLDVYVKTLKSDGIQGLYRGFVISAVGIFIYRGMYFGLYDTLKPLILGEDAGVTLSFILGWGVTVTAGLMSY